MRALNPAAIACLALAAFPVSAFAQVRPDLVSRDRLRICADPSAMPYSDKAKEGFENRIAEIVADELKLPLRYYWMPQGPGFVRGTLGEGMCDLIIGYAASSGVVDHSNPYYASAYALISRPGSGLENVATLEDPHLKTIKLGVIAATPPVDHLLRLGLLDKAKTYDLLVDRRFASPAEQALHDVESGAIDAVILWGPIGGWFAKKANPPLNVAPLHADQRPALAFRISFGLRRNELDWKHRLNDVIRARKGDFEKVLRDYGVPLVPIEAAPIGEAASKGEGAE